MAVPAMHRTQGAPFMHDTTSASYILPYGCDESWRSSLSDAVGACSWYLMCFNLRSSHGVFVYLESFAVALRDNTSRPLCHVRQAPYLPCARKPVLTRAFTDNGLHSSRHAVIFRYRTSARYKRYHEIWLLLTKPVLTASSAKRAAPSHGCDLTIATGSGDH